ncbi:hypothetical protein MKX41_30680 [Paenibacillus sp. FSL R5-0475]|uniref:hypothetical protein n=1 Tax=Paenibacillus sp. FSL R5-0475 TaxID=2921643 RepID=UPI0030F5C5B0
MTHYELGKKYKKIVTVAKMYEDLPSVLVIDDKRYVFDPPRPDGKGGLKDGRTRKPRGSVRKSD